MAEWWYTVSDTNTGDPIANVPLRDVSYSLRMSDTGTLTASLPIDSVKATRAIWGDPDAGGTDRDLTVFRDGTPEFSGPVVTFNPDWPNSVFQITASDVTWHLRHRYLETTDNLNADLFYIVRKIVTNVTSKASTNASLPHFSVMSGNSGYTRTFYWYGPGRPVAMDLIKQLSADPQNGFDFRVDYSAINGLTCAKVLTLGYPSLGVTRTVKLTDANVDSWGRTPDRERAATRVHVVGAGYVKTLQNTGAVTAGEALVEGRFDYTGTTSTSQIDRLATEFRRLAQPPVNTFSVTYRPGGSIGWGDISLGDKVPMQFTYPDILVTSASRRVIQMDVTPGQDNAVDQVRLTFNLPLDSLGA